MSQLDYSTAYSNKQFAGSHYLEMEITTADPLGLVLILYRGAINSLQEALDYFGDDQIENRINAIDKGISMIGELKATLDFERGQPVAGSLDRLYTYMLRRLTFANVQRKPEPVHEVIKLLRTLESAWDEARSAEQAKGSDSPERVELSA